jgi:integrase
MSAWIESKKKNGKYRVRWRDPGTRKLRERLVHTKATAVKLVKKITDAHDLGERWIAPALVEEPEEPSFEDLMEAYLRYESFRLQTSTFRKYEGYLIDLTRYCESQLSAPKFLKLSDIPTRILDDYTMWAFEHGRRHFDKKLGRYVHRKRADATVVKYREVVQLMFRFAEDYDHFSEFMPRIKRPSVGKRKPPQRPITANWDQVAQFIGQFGPLDWRRRLVLILAFTGLRSSQGMGLKWVDFDLEHGMLHFPGHLGKSENESQGRCIPISWHLRDEMKTWARRSEYIVEVPPRLEKSRIARSKDAKRVWMKLDVHPRIYQQRPYHCLRKAFCSNLTGSGAHGDSIEYLVGHSLALRGVYISPEVLPLRQTVDQIPDLRSLIQV